MTNPLDKICQVRSLREQLAQSHLAHGKRRLDQAHRKLADEKMRLQSQRLIQAKIEARLFDEIGRKEVTLDEFEAYCGRIAELRDRWQKCSNKVRQAQTKRDSARSDVHELSAVFQKRCRQHSAIKELCKVENSKQEEENNRWKEEEVEEIVANRFPVNDKDHY